MRVMHRSVKCSGMSRSSLLTRTAGITFYWPLGYKTTGIFVLWQPKLTRFLTLWWCPIQWAVCFRPLVTRCTSSPADSAIRFCILFLPNSQCTPLVVCLAEADIILKVDALPSECCRWGERVWLIVNLLTSPVGMSWGVPGSGHPPLNKAPQL